MSNRGRRLFSFGAAVIATAAGLTACSNAAPETEQQPYSAPAWMADYRAEYEEYNRQLADCIVSQGYQTVETAAGVLMFEEDTGLPRTELEEELATAASNYCLEHVPQPSDSNLSVEDQYDRMLDTRECLIYEGYEVGEAPSKDSWTQAFTNGEAVYYPYFYISERIVNGDIPRISAEEWGSLYEKCVTTRSGTAYYLE